jgi:PAS domain S-box-containing protein
MVSEKSTRRPSQPAGVRNSILARFDMNKTDSESRLSPRIAGAKIDGNLKLFWDGIINFIGEPLLVMDRQHRWVSINDSGCDLTGFRREKILGKTVHDILPKEEADGFWSKDEAVFKTGKDNIHEGKFTDASGMVHTVLIRGKLGVDGNGEQFIFSSIRDITEQKEVEARFAHECQLMRALSDANPDDFYFKDQASRYIRCSGSMARRFKAGTADALIGKTDFDFFSEEHARQTFEEEQQIIRTGKPMRGTTRKEIWSDGRQTWTLTSKLPFRNARGEIIGTFGISKDITWNVLNAEQLRSQAALLDIKQDAIYVRDFSGRIIYWNEGANHLYGWSMAEARGRTVKELNLALDPNESAQALESVQEHNEWSGEMRQKNRAGREILVQSHWNLIRKRDGAPKAILVLNTDITKKRELEVQLLRAQRLESIGTLSSGLAHDLNNVLAPIMMAVHLLKDCEVDKEKLSLLQTLETCSERGANIIRQMLMFARGLKGQRVRLNPKHLIQEMERIVREIFPRSIEIQVSISRDPCTLMADPTQFQQILMNLCVNARDAMLQGGTLTLDLKQVQLDEKTTGIHPKARPGVYVVITVADTGIGMPPELKDKIFDPFFTTKQPGHGTGLGLTIVLGIVENYGGFVQLESQPGKGSSFHVYLPAVPENNEHRDAAAQSTVLAKGNGEVVLVVDDESAILSFATALLKHNGYQTLIAADGQEGLKLFEQQHGAIDLVLCDLIMPQMDGLQMVRELRRIQPNIRTILISGMREENRISEAQAAGIDMVLHKPFTAEQLLTSVKQTLNLKN